MEGCCQGIHAATAATSAARRAVAQARAAVSATLMALAQAHAAGSAALIRAVGPCAGCRDREQRTAAATKATTHAVRKCAAEAKATADDAREATERVVLACVEITSRRRVDGVEGAVKF